MHEIEETSSHNEPDFIRKLLKMISDHPKIINYSQDGTQLVIYDKQLFLDNVLKNNFRHSNWRSFIRQLNMYNFKKINRGLNLEIFMNAIFKRGNEHNFYKIKRKKNPREEERQQEKQVEDRTNSLMRECLQKKPELKQFIRDIFIIKRKSEEPIQAMRNAIQKLGHKRKNKEMKPCLTELQESFHLLDRSSEKFFHAAKVFNRKMQQQESRIPQFSSNYSLPKLIDNPIILSSGNLEFKQEENEKEKKDQKTGECLYHL